LSWARACVALLLCPCIAGQEHVLLCCCVSVLLGRNMCRSSASYNLRGDIVYPTAALGVIYQPSKHTQDFYRYSTVRLCCSDHDCIDIGACAMSVSLPTFFYVPCCSGHNGIDIGACAMDPRGRFVASGEIGARPRVHVWDAVTGTSVAKLAYLHRKGACCPLC
jgi:hypothetical protein